MNTRESNSNIYIQEDEITLKELILKLQEWWKFLLSKWLVILIAATFGGISGVLYAFSQKPEYTAELSFVLEDSQSSGGLGGYSGLASIIGVDLGNSGGGIFVGENLMEFMKSRSMIEKSLLTSINVNGKMQTLAEFYIDINNIRKRWQKDPELKDIYFMPNSDRSKFNRKQDSILLGFYKQLVSKNISVSKKDKKLSIITVAVRTENELLSKILTETLVKEVSQFYIETRTEKSLENFMILQHQTDSVKSALYSAITGVAASVDINPNPNPARQILRVPSQRRQIDVQANTAILQELVRNLELAKVTLRKEKPLIQVVDKPVLPLAVSQVSKKKALILGGVLGGFLSVIVLVFRRILNNL